jgi:hypothetical protein
VPDQIELHDGLQSSNDRRLNLPRT